MSHGFREALKRVKVAENNPEEEGAERMDGEWQGVGLNRKKIPPLLATTKSCTRECRVSWECQSAQFKVFCRCFQFCL